VQVIVYYNPKKKCLEIKGRKANRGHSVRNGKQLDVLKRTHALDLGEVSLNRRTFSGKVDLDTIHSLEEKKSQRPKWKQQVEIKKKDGVNKLIDVKTGNKLEAYAPRLFLEDCKIFVL
jgi:hypothetical protein